jgi:heavy metal translocating P-type ATPase
VPGSGNSGNVIVHEKSRTAPTVNARGLAVNLGRGRLLLPALVLLVLVAAGVLWLAGMRQTAHDVSYVALLITAVPLLAQTVREAIRGNFATDAIATLAIMTAIILDQPIPGLVIVLMQSGGEALEELAQRRASRALEELEGSAPRVAHRESESGLVDVPVESIGVGDILLVRSGELIPADGFVVSGRAHVDTSRITGEPVPVTAAEGVAVMSGCVMLDGAIRMRVSKVAAESQYERIVMLVRTALANKAPIQRVADKYAVWFTPLTLLLAALAYIMSGDPDRILAVLVVATPCPLIIATPVAIIGGINSAAKVGFLFRSGAAIEQLADVRAMIFDKTGTLTLGEPRVAKFVNLGDMTDAELLNAVAAIEQGSSHVMAREIVRYAQTHGVQPVLADHIEEVPGRGLAGRVDGRHIAIGSEEFIAAHTKLEREAIPLAAGNELRSYVAVDGRLAGYFSFADEVRPDLPLMFAGLNAAGVRHTAILSGDDADTVRAVAEELEISDVHADLWPEDKVEHVTRIKKAFGKTAMIGDGVNDAPALAAADIGIAVAERGGGIAAESADVVMLGQDLNRIVDGVSIARRTLRIARQSILVGLSLSLVAMVFASLGYITPIVGALYQELIDVAVILNALRAAAPQRMG